MCDRGVCEGQRVVQRITVLKDYFQRAFFVSYGTKACCCSGFELKFD